MRSPACLRRVGCSVRRASGGHFGDETVIETAQHFRPWYCLIAARSWLGTRCGILSACDTTPLTGIARLSSVYVHSASMTLVAAPCCSPPIAAPPANRSGYVASTAAIVAPTDDGAVTKMRAGSNIPVASANFNMAPIEAASPEPRSASAGLNHRKDSVPLLARGCSGHTC